MGRLTLRIWDITRALRVPAVPGIWGEDGPAMNSLLDPAVAADVESTLERMVYIEEVRMLF